jgi:aerobic carbon-monoxide dehydrogenase medium subunit
MYPPKFDYYRANSVDEALSLMKQHSGAKVLAGGHSLIPAMNLRLADPGTLIDIGRIDSLHGIIAIRDGGCQIGALTPHAEVAKSDLVPTGLAEAASMIGDPQVRNRGTVGGNIAHADPASDLPTVMTALNATIHLTSENGDRDVAAADFFIDLFMTDLQPGELLTAVTIHSPHPGREFNKAAGSAYAKLFNPASRYAIVGAAAMVVVENGQCSQVSVAIGGLTPSARVCPSVNAALQGQAANANNVTAAAVTVSNDLGDDVMGDIHASANYRRQMAPVMVKRALLQAIERAS